MPMGYPKKSEPSRKLAAQNENSNDNNNSKVIIIVILSELNIKFTILNEPSSNNVTSCLVMFNAME